MPTIPVVERLAHALDAKLLVLLSPKVGVTESDKARYDAEDFGRLVRMSREERKWTTAQLAIAAGVSDADVTSFEAGETIPAKPMLDRLLRAMGYAI